MKIPCDPRSENALLPNSLSWPSLLDARTVLRLVKKYGSPLLVGRKSLIQHRFRSIQNGLQDIGIYYAVKANSDRVLLELLREMGAGFDVASLGECERIFDICGSLSSSIFSNPCKTQKAIHWAYKQGCRKFVFDCLTELEKLSRLPSDVELLLRIAVPAGSCQVNLSNRFGASIEQIKAMAKEASRHQRLISGIAFHVGSQANAPKDFENALEVTSVAQELLYRLGHKIRLINIGGGFPVKYCCSDGSSRSMESIDLTAQTYLKEVSQYRERYPNYDSYCVPSENQNAQLERRAIQSGQESAVQWMAEPGRLVVAEAVNLITSVIGFKIDSLGRPVYTIDDGIYGSFSGRYFPPGHFQFYPIDSFDSQEPDRIDIPSMICGPSCDGGDVVGVSTLLPRLQSGNLLQVPMMGAYTSVSASRFNGLPIARRIWID